MSRYKKISMTNQFKRDLKKQYVLLVSPEWAEVFGTLVKDGILDEKYKNHALIGNYVDHLECHVQPDLLLIYKNTPDELTLIRLGSHSELFG